MSEVSDLSEVVDDGVLSESYYIQRSKGEFAAGGWKLTQTQVLSGWGVVSVAKEEDLIMIPEGDRVAGIMVFHSKKRIYETQLDANFGTQGYGQGSYGGASAADNQHFSDIMLWQRQQWRVIAVWPYPNRTFWKAFAIRLAGI
jgi:hypothetical protein